MQSRSWVSTDGKGEEHAPIPDAVGKCVSTEQELWVNEVILNTG